MSDQRTYRSPLRDQQARQTRTHVLETLIELISEEGSAELSVRDLAARAQVSERTVYRYFPDRGALLDGLAEHVRAKAGWKDPAERFHTVDDLVRLIPEVFASYDDFEAETRALVLLNLDPARVAAVTRRNQARLRNVLGQDLPELSASDLDEAAAVLHLLASSRTWLRFRDETGLSASGAARAAQRAAAAIVSDLRARSDLGEAEA